MKQIDPLIVQFNRTKQEIAGYVELYQYSGGYLVNCPYKILTTLWIKQRDLWVKIRDKYGYSKACDLVD